MSDDLRGWTPGQLSTIARWYLVRGFGLRPDDDAWRIEITRAGATCDQQTRCDQRLVDEGLRLITAAYPRRNITVRRDAQVEVERPPSEWDI